MNQKLLRSPINPQSIPYPRIVPAGEKRRIFGHFFPTAIRFSLVGIAFDATRPYDRRTYSNIFSTYSKALLTEGDFSTEKATCL